MNTQTNATTPQTFAQFRLAIAWAILQVRPAAQPFATLVSYVDNEGGPVVSALWSVWRDIEAEDMKKCDPATFWDAVYYYIHDMMVTAIVEWSRAYPKDTGSWDENLPADVADRLNTPIGVE